MNNRNRANLAIGIALGAAVAASLSAVVSLTASLEVTGAQPGSQFAGNAVPVVLSDAMLRYNHCLQSAIALYPDDWGTEAARWCYPMAESGIAWVSKDPADCLTYQLLGRNPEVVRMCG